VLSIEVDPDLRGHWLPYKEVFVEPNALTKCIITEPFASMRFKFTPIGKAQVSAWVVLEN
jgi:hypothetical protein